MAAAGDAGRVPRNVADATHDLYRQYGKQIYAYCLHQLRSREEAEDAVQTTFLNAFRGFQRGTTTRFEQAWLYKIAQNVCIARRSSTGRRLKLESPDDFEILEEVVPSAGASADSDTLELMGLEEALDSMPENQRRAILLREWQGLSYREIAAELGLSQGAVEMLIFRARRTLATALEQPEVAEKRRTGKAKTGFSLGSLVASMKSLFSTGAALKMAAAGVSAAVVGTSAVHSVVQQVMPQWHMRAAARSASHDVVKARAVSVVPVAKVDAVLVSQRTSHAGGAPAATLAEAFIARALPEQRPVVAPDAAAPPPVASVETSPPPAPVASAPSVSSIAPPAAPLAPQASPDEAPSGTTNPQSPPSAGGGSDSGTDSQHSGGPTGGGGGDHHTHGTDNAGDNGGGKAAGKDHRDESSSEPTTTTTPTDTTTTTADTTTTTTTPTASDPLVPASDTSTTPTTQSTMDTTTTTTTTMTTTTTTTTTPTSGNDGSGSGSGSGSSSTGSPEHHHDGGGGGGGNGNGGGGGHGHGH